MASFRERFETDFGSTKKIKELTKQFERVNSKEFKKINERMKRFKFKKI